MSGMAPPASSTFSSAPLPTSAASRVLTSEDVLRLTKRKSLQDVLHLNAWGMQLQDVSVVSELPSVEVLSLSVNGITSLESFRHASQLREVYLRRNMVSDMAHLIYLVGLPHLRVLWLADNPICRSSSYRLSVLAFLPGLHQLDNIDVTPQEVEQARGLVRGGDPALVAAMGRARSLVPTWSPPPDLLLPRLIPSTVPLPPRVSPPTQHDKAAILAASSAPSYPPSRPEAATTQTEGPAPTSHYNNHNNQAGGLPPPPPPPQTLLKRAPMGRPNVMSAVLLLLEELDTSSLKLVAQRCQDMLLLLNGEPPMEVA